MNFKTTLTSRQDVTETNQIDDFVRSTSDTQPVWRASSCYGGDLGYGFLHSALVVVAWKPFEKMTISKGDHRKKDPSKELVINHSSIKM